MSYGDGVDGREYAGKEQAYGKLTGSKPIECRRQGLKEEEDTGQNQGIAHGSEEAVMLSEAAPERSRNGAGKSSERKGRGPETKTQIIHVLGPFEKYTS